MAEYIEREALKKKIDNACDECRQSCLEFDGIFADCSQCILQDIQSIPTADVRLVAHGNNLRGKYPSLFECSECRWKCNDTLYGDTNTYNFCPNCGVIIDG